MSQTKLQVAPLPESAETTHMVGAGGALRGGEVGEVSRWTIAPPIKLILRLRWLSSVGLELSAACGVCYE